MNKSFRINQNEVFKSRLTTVYHSLVKNKKGEGKGGLKETGGGFFNFFFPSNRGWLISGGGLFEWEGFIDDLQ